MDTEIQGTHLKLLDNQRLRFMSRMFRFILNEQRREDLGITILGHRLAILEVGPSFEIQMSFG